MAHLISGLPLEHQCQAETERSSLSGLSLVEMSKSESLAVLGVRTIDPPTHGYVALRILFRFFNACNFFETFLLQVGSTTEIPSRSTSVPCRKVDRTSSGWASSSASASSSPFPWSTSNAMAVAQWTALLRQCLLSRASPEDVVKLAQQMQDHNGKAILKALLDCRQSFCIPSDPLPPRYLESLLTSHTIALSDLLLILTNKWNGSARATKPVPMSQAEIGSLQEVSLLLTSRLVVDRPDTQRCLMLASRWLTVLVRSTTVTLNSQIAEAVGSFLATLSATNIGITMLSEKRDGDKKPLKETVRQATEVAVASYPALSVHLIERLGAVQKHIAMFDETQEQSSMQALQIQANIPETPMAASRAGTILYLETMIFTARTIDDTIVFNFLAGRHNNHWTAMFLDGLFASFQVLKRSRDGNIKALRFPQADVYIRNKLTSILATISGSSFGVVLSEQALTSAWDQIRTELTTPEALLCGQHFLHTCSLHHLLSSEAAHQLIGDQQLASNLPKGLYSKDELVSQVNSNHSRMSKLIEELTHADGSGAAISQTVVEMIMAFCQSKETHHISDMANTILKNPVVINALAMFVRPSYWLGPLCTLLDEWGWDEIQGESQPVYEEFGSILLLVIASKRRLGLSLSEMGMQEGFVVSYFDQEGSEGTLSDRSVKHLGDWIHAMYMTEGLGDEVTTSCSPQELYLLVPNLLRQSIVAHQKGKLTLEGLKGGLECELLHVEVRC
jgi:mediator of RNA polymerase II transcription subunit 5